MKTLSALVGALVATAWVMSGAASEGHDVASHLGTVAVVFVSFFLQSLFPIETSVFPLEKAFSLVRFEYYQDAY